MRPSIGFVIACSAVLVASTAAYAQKIPNLPKLRLGLTRAQVASAYPDFREYYVWGRGDEFGRRDFELAGCKVNLYIYFKNDRVSNVMFERRESRGDPCRDQIRAALNRQYGERPPSREQYIRGTIMERVTEWRSGGAAISYVEYVGRSFVVVSQIRPPGSEFDFLPPHLRRFLFQQYPHLRHG